MTEAQIQRLIATGVCAEWTRDSMHRLYVRDLPAAYGLEIDCYRTGNICDARVDGERVSNSEGRRILGRLSMAKIYYDYADSQWHGKNVNQRDFERIVARLLSSVEEVA